MFYIISFATGIFVTSAIIGPIAGYNNEDTSEKTSLILIGVAILIVILSIIQNLLSWYTT